MRDEAGTARRRSRSGLAREEDAIALSTACRLELDRARLGSEVRAVVARRCGDAGQEQQPDAISAIV